MEPIGTCDYSGFLLTGLIWLNNIEWRGNQLIWTGAIVRRPLLMEPNEQNRPPQIKGDPKAVQNPRPFGIETPPRP